MNWNEKLAIIASAFLVGGFAADGVDHQATWPVAVSAIVVTVSVAVWVRVSSNWRRQSQRIDR